MYLHCIEDALQCKCRCSAVQCIDAVQCNVSAYVQVHVQVHVHAAMSLVNEAAFPRLLEKAQEKAPPT